MEEDWLPVDKVRLQHVQVHQNVADGHEGVSRVVHFEARVDVVSGHLDQGYFGDGGLKGCENSEFGDWHQTRTTDTRWSRKI